MILNVAAEEDLKTGDRIVLMFADDRVLCRRCRIKEAPDAIALRDIGEHEVVLFDAGQDTMELGRPPAHAYDPEFR